MQVNVRHLEGLQFEAVTRGHTITGDQPVENGGQDGGMTPAEWFLASLGSCIGFYVVKYCQARSIDTKGLDIGVTAEKTTDAPHRIDAIKVSLNFTVAVETSHYEGLEQVVNNCLIHNTLTHSPSIAVQVSTPVTDRCLLPWEKERRKKAMATSKA